MAGIFIGLEPLFPVGFALCEVGFHDVRVQFEAETGAVGGLDVTILDDGTFMDDDVVHPISVTQHRLRCEKITNGAGPVRVAMVWTMLPVLCVANGSANTSARSAIRFVSRNPPVLRKSGWRMSQPWLMMKSLNPCRRLRFSPVQMGTFELATRRRQLSEYSTGIGSSSQSGRIGSTASAIWIEVRRSYSQ